MNENELSRKDLRALASAEPREAPARVEQLLMTRFRARRRERAYRVVGIDGGGNRRTGRGDRCAGLDWSRRRRRRRVRCRRQCDDDAESFYPLPVADTLPPLETAMVVRVELPMSSLRLMGVPVGEDPGERG